MAQHHRNISGMESLLSDSIHVSPKSDEMMAKCKDPSDSLEASSKSIHEMASGSHTFTVRGYSLTKGMGPGNYISSDTFNVGGYDFAIYFYPDGKHAGDKSYYLSVFIGLASEGTDIRALFELTLMDQSGKGKHKVYMHRDRALESGPCTLKSKGATWGYTRFIQRTSLETSDFLKDDCLSMHCTVGVVRSRLEAPKLYRVPVPPSDMGDSLKYLLDAELGWDVIFQVGEEEFKAHKLILAARSPVFKGQFLGLVGNPDSEKVDIEDVEPSIFKALLQFIYSDIFPDFNEIIVSSSMSTSTIRTQHLLAASDRFGVDRLKQLCEVKLCEEVSTDTVATTLCLAEQHRCPQLKAMCLKFAATNLEVVMMSEGYKHLEKSCPSLMSELLEIVASVDGKSNNNDVSVYGSAGKKSSGSSTSIFGLDLEAAAAADGRMQEFIGATANTRRLRSRLIYINI